MKVIKGIQNVFNEALLLCVADNGLYTVIKIVNHSNFSRERNFNTLRKANRYFEINKERMLEDMRYVTEYEMKDIETLKDLSEEGYVGISDTRLAVKELTEDDVSIENLINKLEA